MSLRSPTENENGGISLHPNPNFQRRSWFDTLTTLSTVEGRRPRRVGIFLTKYVVFFVAFVIKLNF